jgi:hypothetical protein
MSSLSIELARSGDERFAPIPTGPTATGSGTYNIILQPGGVASDQFRTVGGRRAENDDPAVNSGGGGGGVGGLLQSIEDAGNSLLRAALSLVPAVRFKPWPPTSAPPAAERRQDNSERGDGLRRVIDRASIPADRQDAADWRPLAV